MEEGRRDPESMTEPRTQCRKCGTSILVVTAGRFDGRCAPCWAKRPSKVIREVLVTGPSIMFDVIATPFSIVRECVGIIRRRWRFPYAMAPLRKRVEAVYRGRRDARLYLGGLMRGYDGPSDITALPFDARDLARDDGFYDGVALRKGQAEISALPLRWRSVNRGVVSRGSERDA